MAVAVNRASIHCENVFFLKIGYHDSVVQFLSARSSLQTEPSTMLVGSMQNNLVPRAFPLKVEKPWERGCMQK